MKKLPLLLWTVMGASVNHAAIAQDVSPKNIIMVVADGMGPAYTSAYRYYADDPNTPEIEQTVFDRHHVGNSSTYPAPVSGYVTDSAAGATALASGVKSYNGAIGVDVDKNPVESVLVYAKKQGKKTGIVVTSQINHATPAAYITHNESRRNYDAIADNYFDDRVNNSFVADVMLGGGWKYFIRKDRNLVKEFQQAGYQYLDKPSQLAALPVAQPVIGLFADKGLPWAKDDTDPYRLKTMTEAATKQLANSKGYFMLIEASMVDWGGHANDITAAMAEMADLAKTMEFLENYVKNNPDTLVVLTADHSTGGFTIGANGVYQWQPVYLKNLTQSPEAIGKQLAKQDITHVLVTELLKFSVSDDELQQLNQVKTEAEQAELAFNELTKEQKKSAKWPLSPAKALHKAVNKIVDERSNTGWTSSGHTAVDVPVFALGLHKDRFTGQQDNIDIAKKLFKLLSSTNLEN